MVPDFQVLTARWRERQVDSRPQGAGKRTAVASRRSEVAGQVGRGRSGLVQPSRGLFQLPSHHSRRVVCKHWGWHLPARRRYRDQGQGAGHARGAWPFALEKQPHRLPLHTHCPLLGFTAPGAVKTLEMREATACERAASTVCHLK